MKTDTLLIGPFKDMSGYAKLGKTYIRALFGQGDVSRYAMASVRYDSGGKTELPQSFVDAHNQPISNEIETVVQIITPNEMRPIPGKRNIAICCWETDRIPPYWAMALNAFDEIIVPCEANKQAFIQSKVVKPIHIIGMPAFTEDYDLEGVTPFQIPSLEEGATVYYNIAQWSHKKGIDALIRSYFLAFQNNENVMLLLKGYVGMKNQKGDAQKVVSAVQEIKNSMRLTNYPKVFITDLVTDEDGLKKIHLLGDCYANMSRGEGWGIPPFEALIYGNELISTLHTGMAEYIRRDQNDGTCINAYPIVSVQDSVHNMPHPDPTLYTANDNWWEPVILSGAMAFRAHYANSEKINTEVEQAVLCEAFAPEIIGKLLGDIIHAR